MRRCLIAALFFIFLFAAVGEVTAHPLGNFSISQYSAIRVDKETVEIRYIIDMAEIPTFQEIQETGIVPQAGDSSLDTYLKRKTDMLTGGLTLEINGLRLTPLPESREIIFPPGAGGLPTMKIGILYKAKLGDAKGGEYLLSYRDGNFPGRAGWKEIIAVAGSSASLLNSSVPETDRSSQLNDYPTDLLNSPPQELEAKVTFSTLAPVSVAATASSRIDSVARERPRPISKVEITRAQVSQSSSKVEPEKQSGDTQIASPIINDADSTATNDNAPVLEANRQTTPRNSFTELIATENLGFGIVLIALGVAVGLGAFHALEPGHGKTLVAAYLVGSRGTVQHAFLLGLIVTAAHTAGVYLLGAVTLYASQYILPERLYPWLGVVSGVLIAGLGAVLLVRRYLGKDGLSNHHHHHLDHSHGLDDHDHHHHHHRHDHHHGHGHSHDHGHTHRDHDVDRQVSFRELLTLGISGGIVPCPAALVVLLSAVSMQRIGFGLLLIVAFSFGLAAVLITIGLLMVSARQFMSRFQVNSRLTTQWLPLTSSAFILVFGIALAIQSLQSAGLLQLQL
jgi:ABC-type nickel/cobalt efflux system permease component RcnA